MRKRRQKRTFILLITMTICMVMTILLLSGSVNCSDCGKKLVGKYYTTEFQDPMCVSCAGAYYKESRLDMKRYLQKADNGLRNLLLTVETVVFLTAIIGVNIRRRKPVLAPEVGYTVDVNNRKRSVIVKSPVEHRKREYVPRMDREKTAVNTDKKTNGSSSSKKKSASSPENSKGKKSSTGGAEKSSKSVNSDRKTKSGRSSHNKKV